MSDAIERARKRAKHGGASRGVLRMDLLAALDYIDALEGLLADFGFGSQDADDPYAEAEREFEKARRRSRNRRGASRVI